VCFVKYVCEFLPDTDRTAWPHKTRVVAGVFSRTTFSDKIETKGHDNITRCTGALQQGRVNCSTHSRLINGHDRCGRMIKYGYKESEGPKEDQSAQMHQSRSAFLTPFTKCKVNQFYFLVTSNGLTAEDAPKSVTVGPSVSQAGEISVSGRITVGMLTKLSTMPNHDAFFIFH